MGLNARRIWPRTMKWIQQQVHVRCLTVSSPEMHLLYPSYGTLAQSYSGTRTWVNGHRLDRRSTLPGIHHEVVRSEIRIISPAVPVCPRYHCASIYETHSILVGSSSGSAVAVSANIVPLSFGTETDTSIIGPAMINGVVGIKPTVGLTSRSGVIPISEYMDTVGPFGRTLADAVHGLNAIVGADKRDIFTLQPFRHQEEDYTTFIKSKAVLKGARFGLPCKGCWDLVPPDQKMLASRLFTAITDAGGEIMHTDFPCAEERIPSDGNWDW